MTGFDKRLDFRVGAPHMRIFMELLRRRSAKYPNRSILLRTALFRLAVEEFGMDEAHRILFAGKKNVGRYLDYLRAQQQKKGKHGKN